MTGEPPELDDEDVEQRWVEGLTRARVTRFERVHTGSSLDTWLVDVFGGPRLVLRKQGEQGSLTGTEFGLAREAVAYRALSGSGVAISRLVAARHDALLIERAAGTTNSAAEAYDGFCEALGALHRVDVDSLDLEGFARDPVADLELWHAALVERVRRPAALLHFASRWLRVNAPERPGRVVLCHGQAGAGHFLHEGRQVTALLDWELCHVGDPMDDLAWVTVQAAAAHSPFPDVNRSLARYRAAAGLRVDPARVRWWRAVVLWRLAISCSAALDSRDATVDLTPYVLLAPRLSRRLVEALALLMEVTLEPVDLPALGGGHEPTVADEVHDSLALLLATGGRPEAFFLLDHIQAVARTGSAVAAANEHELAHPVADDVGELQRFGRITGRELSLWPMLATVAMEHYAEIAE